MRRSLAEPPTAAVALAGVCFVSSGYLALTYEVCWIRQASLTIGATTLAFSTVLAVFFAGLAAGSFVFGRVSQRIARPVRLYAALEIGIGLVAMTTPWTFPAVESLFGRFYPSVYESFARLSAVRSLAVAILLLPPTFLMGGTLPLFCRQFVSSEGHISGRVGLLYGLNTLGAAAGAFVCGFFLIPTIGVRATLLGAGALNVLVGAVAWALPMPEVARIAGRPREEPDPHRSAPAERSGQARWIGLLFFATGFVALGNEILWTRYLSLLLHDTVYTYTLALTVTLLGIVAGSLLSAGLFDRLEHRARLFGWVQVGAGLLGLSALLLHPDVWSRWLDARDVPTQAVIIVALFAGPAALSGAVFPLAIRMVVRSPEAAGSGVGWMTALNTLGGILGSLALAFAVLPAFGLHRSLLVTSGLSVAIGCVAWTVLDRRAPPLTRFAWISGSVLVWSLIPRVSGTRLPHDFLARGRELVEVAEGVSSNLAVIRTRDRRRVLEIDRLWQGEDRKTHQILAAHIPMLIHPDPARVAVVGVGVGQTASRFLSYPIERLDCIEIERDMFPLLRRHFDAGWMDDERVHVVIEDGRNYLAHAPRTYDLISIEVGQTFRPGIASFYTADFYRRARARLEPGGLLAQMVPISFFDIPDFRTVVRTFAQVFPQCTLWYNRHELLLVGTTSDRFEIPSERLGRLQSDPVLRADLDFALWGGLPHRLNQPEVFLAGFLAGPQEVRGLGREGTVYRDDRPHLEYSTPLHRDAFAAKQSIVELLGSTLTHPDAVLSAPLDPAVAARVERVRRANLGNILAGVLEDQFPGLGTEAQREAALGIVSRGLEYNPDNARLNMLMGLTLNARGAGKEAALGFLRRALELRPTYAEAHLNSASVYRAHGDGDAAERHYRSALEHDPSLESARFFLGTLLLEDGRSAQAEPLFRRLLETRPRSADALHGLGVALLAQGHDEEAVEVLRRGVEAAPGRSDLRGALEEALDR